MKKKDEWGNHSDVYSEDDIYMFNKLLPTLICEPAREEKWAKEEHKQMMNRFRKSFE